MHIELPWAEGAGVSPGSAVFSEETFFTYVRRAPFGGRLLQAQIDGMHAILAQPWSSDDHLAYALATAFHETAGTMKPIRETGAASDAKAIAILDRAYAAGKLPQVKTPYWRRDKDGKSWLGRGFVQLTHRRNYEALARIVGVDLVASPEKAMLPDVAAQILFEGMTRGTFTGKKLSDYFGEDFADPVGARKIVNGTDKAKLISTYYKAFRDALAAAREDARKNDVSARLAMADDVPAEKSKPVLAIAAALVGSGGLGVAKDTLDSGAGLLGAVANPWAFSSLALIVLVLAVGAWLVLSGRITVNRGRQ